MSITNPSAAGASANAAGAVEDDDDDDDDVLELHADEDDLTRPTSILRPPRSFEQKLLAKVVKINMSGIIHHVWCDIDPRTKRREDRRGQYILDRQAKKEAVSEARARMSDAEEIADVQAAAEAKADQKLRKMQKWERNNARRLDYVLDNQIYCNENGDECITGEGVDAFEGDQASLIPELAKKMAAQITNYSQLVTKDANATAPTWRDTVDGI